MNRTFLLLLILPFIGCTTPNMIMKSWVGHRENELYLKWGTPSKTIDNGSNGKIALYEPDVNKDGGKSRFSASRYVNTGKPVESIRPGNNEYKKIKAFYISPMGNIYAWKWE